VKSSPLTSGNYISEENKITGKSDKPIRLPILKLWLWSSLQISGSISLYIKHVFIWTSLQVYIVVWSVCYLSFQALSLAVYAGINILVSTVLTFPSPKLLDFSLGVGPRQP